MLISILFVLSSLPARAIDACGPKIDPGAVELIEVEAKYLVPDLGALPPAVIEALQKGRLEDQVPRRGLVLQEYLPVTPENLDDVYAALARAQVPFGGSEDRAKLREPGAAREIRLMTKSILVAGRPTLIRQLGIKAAGGVAVNQIESPEHLDAPAADALAEIFARFRPRVMTTVRKIYFEVAHPFGTFEIDAYLSPAGLAEAPIFVNGEIEFHGSDATTEAARWRAETARHPAYLGRDLTDLPGCKARDIATHGPPATVVEDMRAHRTRNHEIILDVGREVRTWADRGVADRVLGSPERPAVGETRSRSN